MDFALSNEHDLVKETAKRFAEETISPVARDLEQPEKDPPPTRARPRLGAVGRAPGHGGLAYPSPCVSQCHLEGNTSRLQVGPGVALETNSCRESGGLEHFEAAS